MYVLVGNQGNVALFNRENKYDSFRLKQTFRNLGRSHLQNVWPQLVCIDVLKGNVQIKQTNSSSTTSTNSSS